MKQVFIIDDAMTVRMFHRQLVSSLGYRVVEAENGVEGLEKLTKECCDLILVDVNMPCMDGYRFVRSVRESSEWRDIPVVMISTEAQQSDLQKAYAAGANFYMTKPTDPLRLKRLMNLLLGSPEAVADDTQNRGVCT